MTRLDLPLYVALAASILSAVPANGSRDTLPHQRMIRRRGPGPIDPKVVAFDHGLYVRQATDTASASGVSTTAAAQTTTTPSSTAAASTTSPTSSPVTTSTPPSSTVASTTSGGLLDSLTSLLATSTTVSTSTTPSTTSVAPSTSATPTSVAPSTAPATSQAVTPSLNLATAAPTSSKPSASNVVVTSTVVTPAEEASQSAAAAKKAKITQNTIISLVVIAACIGGAIAIWTVIRKWKLSPSEKFDDRMQPIDWAPQGAGGAAEETMEEKRHRRAGSSGSHGSFTSAGAGKSESGHANNMYSDSQHGHAYGVQGQDFPPAHDFTAGASQPGYGQYYGAQQYAGGAGYADLQRGPSMSESTYSHGASVTRGLSYSRGPTAGYEAQPGAAGVPPLPNPYGGEYGYDDYGPQAGQPQAQAQAHQAQVPYRGYN